MSRSPLDLPPADPQVRRPAHNAPFCILYDGVTLRSAQPAAITNPTARNSNGERQRRDDWAISIYLDLDGG
jgi:hypothetical protein